MLISTKGRYALRVLADMAEHQAEGYIPLKEIAERQEISEKYLESIVKELVKNNVVSGVRGKGGGYRLCRLPEQICLRDVLQYMEGSLAPVACLEEGAAPCGRSARCSTLDFWRGLYECILNYASGFTLADLMQTGQPGDDYII